MSKKNSVNIYVDNQNIKLNLELANLLLTFAKIQGALHRANIYDFWPDNNPNASQKYLENLGFNCISVISPLKDCADYQLVFDCIGDLDGDGWPNIIILVSGDGDFQPLVSHLKKIGIKAIVFARKGNVKKTLIDAANEFHLIEELPKLIGSQNQSQNNMSEPNGESKKKQSQKNNAKKNKNNQSGITYNQAIACLIEAIKTASSQEKPTRFSYIDNLMRNNPKFPNYKGVASIQKTDGQKFSKFGKFIETAVKDGKVRIKKNCQVTEVILR